MRSRTMSRSARNGEMNAAMTIRPASTNSFAHLADAADVLDAVRVGEAEVLVEAVADVVAVEQVGVMAAREQRLLRARWRCVDLPEPERPVNQSDRRLAGPSGSRAFAR